MRSLWQLFGLRNGSGNQERSAIANLAGRKVEGVKTNSKISVMYNNPWLESAMLCAWANLNTPLRTAVDKTREKRAGEHTQENLTGSNDVYVGTSAKK